VALVADGPGRARSIFYAQLDSEIAFVKSFFKNIPQDGGKDQGR